MALLASCWTSAADAREGAPPAIDIAAAPLGDALAELSREAGVSIGTPGSLPAHRTRALHGRLSVEAALARLLDGTGLVARRVGATAWRIERAATPPPTQPSRAEPAPEVTEAEPIVVTAPKRAVALDSLPMALAVLRLDAAQAADPASGTATVAARSEGLAMTALGPGRNRLFLRGVADSPFNGETQSTVAVVLDDARLTYAAPDPDIRLVDVERVEVLKGPQGSLYGSGALGGIYHIVTRRADVREAALSASALGESVAHGGLGRSAAAAGNLPIAADRAALRVVGYSAREAGWIDSGARKDSNVTRLFGTRANLGVEAGDGWRADVSGLLQLLESRDSRYVYAPGARHRAAQQAEPHDNDMRHISARIAREGSAGGDLDVVLSTGIAWHEVGDRLDATQGASGFGLADPARLADERNYRVWDSEARIGGHFGGVRWMGGVSHVEARQEAVSTLHAFTGASVVIDDDRRLTRDTALFGDVTVPLGAGFAVDAGGRLFRTAVRESRVLAGGTVTRERRRDGITPSVSLSWQLAPERIVYLRYASAYRQGGSDIGAGGQLETLKSDELQTMEAGYRGTFGGGGHFDLGLYASRWKNLQSDMLQANGLIESENAGNARIMGLEATLDLPLGERLGLEAGANVTDARLVRNMLGRRLEDRRLPVVPRMTARMALIRRFELGRADGMVRATLRYVGAQRLSFDPAIDREMGAYLETGIEAQARLGRLRLSLAADNLLGGASNSFAFGNPLRFALTRQYTPQRPRTLSLGLGTDF